MAGNRTRAAFQRDPAALVAAGVRTGVQLGDLDPEVVHTVVERVPVPMDRLLAGAWRRVPTIAARHRVDPGEFTARLAAYTAGCITGRTAHDFASMELALMDLVDADA